jgi:protein-glutamine gamma-glutamyltransferase
MATICAQGSPTWERRSRLARTLVAFGLVSVLVTAAWVRLETGGTSGAEVLTVLVLALLPALAVERRRGRVTTGVVLAISSLFAASGAMNVPLGDARALDPDRDFAGPLVSAIREGFLDYYDTTLPFNPADFPLMHGLVLLAIFGFTAAGGVLIAARRPVAAAAVLLVALGWPATLIPGDRPLAAGALALAGVLALLFLLRPGTTLSRGVAGAALAGVALVGVSTAASASDAVAKPGFLSWQAWDLYDRPDDPVSVSYVWDAYYDGIDFPEKETVVLRVRVPGPRRALYWRATTLDEYTGAVWREAPGFLTDAEPADEIDVTGLDPLLPERARSRRDWIRQEIEVEALRDAHLIGSAQPARWKTGTSAPVRVASNGAVFIQGGLRQGQRYTAWSYVPDAKPKQLANAPATYSPELERYLTVAAPPFPNDPLPEFAASDRDEFMQRFFAESYFLQRHERVYEEARRVTEDARSPYAAAAMLEAWFRADGDFVYTEQPPPYGPTPPLVFFLESKQGYCQQFAGTMALMLRFLGIPARVAAGFTSGSYDDDKNEWTVTDHNAHTWVEAYFPGYGWIPFDPTPNRGQLTSTYSPFSAAFDAAEAAGVFPNGLALETIRSQIDDPRSGRVEPEESVGTGGSNGIPGAVADKGGSLLSFLLLVAALAVGAIVATKWVRRRLRFLTNDPRELAGACRRDLVGFVADQGLDPPVSATLAELGELVESVYYVDSDPFVRATTEARYGRPDKTGRAAHRARSELRRLRRRMSGELSFGRRVRGALSVRSLTV